MHAYQLVPTLLACFRPMYSICIYVVSERNSNYMYIVNVYYWICTPNSRFHSLPMDGSTATGRRSIIVVVGCCRLTLGLCREASGERPEPDATSRCLTTLTLGLGQRLYPSSIRVCSTTLYVWQIIKISATSRPPGDSHTPTRIHCLFRAVRA